MLLNVSLPVLNEEKDLAKNVPVLMEFLKRWNEIPYEVVIADNGSTDQTAEVARRLAQEHAPHLRVLQLRERGRGRAVKRAWTESRADIVSYMDIDLSADLECFPMLIHPLLKGTCDLAVGSRLHKDSQTTRGLKREILSKGYNTLTKLLLGAQFSDAQCGFKALSRKAADVLLPLVKDDEWFFDTEMLVIAARRGLRIQDVPIRWVDDPDTRVKVWSTMVKDLKGLARLWRDKG